MEGETKEMSPLRAKRASERDREKEKREESGRETHIGVNLGGSPGTCP